MATTALKYGFRHDPMELVAKGDSLQAALVRRHVFQTANPGDDALFRARIEIKLI